MQNVVLAFVDAQQRALDQIASLQAERQQTLSRIASMDEELSSHKAHIRTLKNELTAACRRQISDDAISDNMGVLVSSHIVSWQRTSGRSVSHLHRVDRQRLWILNIIEKRNIVGKIGFKMG